MDMKHLTDPEAIDGVIARMKDDLKGLQRKRSKIRKVRSDKGTKRDSYTPTAPLKYRQYMGRANQKGLPFEITVDQFNMLLSSRCVYCSSSSRITIDRKDSSLGYTEENCQPCCYICNTMKWDQSEEDFLRQIQRVYQHRLETR